MSDYAQLEHRLRARGQGTYTNADGDTSGAWSDPLAIEAADALASLQKEIAWFQQNSEKRGASEASYLREITARDERIASLSRELEASRTPAEPPFPLPTYIPIEVDPDNDETIIPRDQREETIRLEARELAIEHCARWIADWGVDSSAAKLCLQLGLELRNAFSTQGNDLSRAQSGQEDTQP